MSPSSDFGSCLKILAMVCSIDHTDDYYLSFQFEFEIDVYLKCILNNKIFIVNFEILRLILKL